MNKSWKTTLSGLGALFAVLGPALNAQFDGKVETVPQWDLVLLGVFSFLMGSSARDNDKSSEQVGAKESKPQVPLAVIALLCVLTLTGCASAEQTAKSRTQVIYGLAQEPVKVGTNTFTRTVTNSITVIDEKEVSGNVHAVGDAKQAVQAMNAKNTKATQAIGIAGVEQESSLEGLKDIIKMLFDAGKEAGKATATGGVVK